MEHVIVINPNGAVKSVHNDKFNLGFLGPQTIQRASDIRFDEDSQTWGIWFKVRGDFHPPALPSHYGFDSYETARQVEVRIMNESMKTGSCPTRIQ